MNEALRETLRKKVGGSLSRLDPLRRLTMLRLNARALTGDRWQPPANDGTLVRKAVGRTRR